MSTVEQAWCRSLPWRAFTRRVVFPWVAGYDLAVSGPSRLLHRLDRSHHRLATVDQLRRRLDELPSGGVAVAPGLGGLVARFRATRTAEARPNEVSPAGSTR